MAKKRKSFLDGILYFVNILVALGLLTSYLAYYIQPGWLTFFAFSALAYPVLLFSNIIFILYWAIKLKPKFFLSLIVIVIGFLHLGRYYQLSGTQKVTIPSKSLKVMTFNVRMFNYYQWIESVFVPQKVKTLVDSEQPDVLIMQEYFKNKDTPNFGYRYKHLKMTNYGHNYGLAIFSKHPIIGSGIIRYNRETTIENDDFHYADIDWNGKIVRVINIHLASVGFGSKDYELLEKGSIGNNGEVKDGVITILKRLHWAYKRRAQQIRVVEEAIDSSPHPVILCGDFNDTPQSFTYHRIDLELVDSFLEAGHGFSKSYVRSPVPLRIDYIFHSDELRAFNFKVIDQELSDHYPVVTELEWK